MIDIQSIVPLSPKGTDLLASDDGTPEVKRRSALGLLTRRLTTSFARSTLDDIGKPLSSSEDSIRQIKMQILYKNPVIYQMFRERLVENFYTHWGVCYSLHDFLDNILRIPDLRDEIIYHRFATKNRPRGGGLFAYLTGDISPSPSPQKKRLGTRSTSVSTEITECTGGKDLMDNLSRQSHCLSIPSLDSTGNSTDDDSLGDGSSSSSISSPKEFSSSSYVCL
jgi:hypothetical protein